MGSGFQFTQDGLQGSIIHLALPGRGGSSDNDELLVLLLARMSDLSFHFMTQSYSFPSFFGTSTLYLIVKLQGKRG